MLDQTANHSTSIGSLYLYYYLEKSKKARELTKKVALIDCFLQGKIATFYRFSMAILWSLFIAKKTT